MRCPGCNVSLGLRPPLPFRRFPLGNRQIPLSDDPVRQAMPELLLCLRRSVHFPLLRARKKTALIRQCPVDRSRLPDPQGTGPTPKLANRWEQRVLAALRRRLGPVPAVLAKGRVRIPGPVQFPLERPVAASGAESLLEFPASAAILPCRFPARE